MAYVIIRGNNGRRHEVDFENAEIKVEVHINEENVELVIEALDEDRPREKSGLLWLIFRGQPLTKRWQKWRDPRA